MCAAYQAVAARASQTLSASLAHSTDRTWPWALLLALHEPYRNVKTYLGRIQAHELLIKLFNILSCAWSMLENCHCLFITH